MQSQMVTQMAKMIKPTPKQVDVIKQLKRDDWVMMILHGGVRAGKTFINNLVFLYELERVRALAENDGKQPTYILAGTQSSSIERNIITPLGEMFGIYPRRDAFGNYHIRGVKVVPAMDGSISGLKSVRGFTAYGAYINEASLAHPEVFSEILKRISGVDSARVMVDTNPDIPMHWLKTDYIDKAMNSSSDRYTAEEHAKSRILQFQFILDDNTSLSERTRENIKAVTPSGMMYERAILGRWVAGQGAVYVDFNESTQYFDATDLPEIKEYYVGVDWGYEHLGTILLFGDDYNDNTYLIREWTSQHKGIDYWVKIAKDIVSEYGNINFWVDSARPDNVNEFLRNGIRANNAKKDILHGIEVVAGLMKENKIFAVKNANEFRYEIGSYVWDRKTGYPTKENDHVLDALRYAIVNQHDNSNKIKLFTGGF